MFSSRTAKLLSGHRGALSSVITDNRRRATGVRVGEVEIQSSIVISDAGIAHFLCYNYYAQSILNREFV